MNKAKIIAEVEKMVVARLFSRQPWLADRETVSAVDRKLILMGLNERICADTYRATPLGKELDIDLFEVFMGLFDAWDAAEILKHYSLIDKSECEVIYARLSKEDAESVLIGYVKRAYFDYRKATKFLH
jgi:hypothetical protein